MPARPLIGDYPPSSRLWRRVPSALDSFSQVSPSMEETATETRRGNESRSSSQETPLTGHNKEGIRTMTDILDQVEAGSRTSDTEEAKSAASTAHRRNVSWGMNETMDELPPRPPKLSERSTSVDGPPQPNLHRREPSEFSLGDAANIRLPYQPTRRKLSTIDLEELTMVNPMETEAETYLIKAIELREPSLFGGVDSSPAVLSHVPESVVSAMSNSNAADDESGPVSSSNQDDESKDETGARSRPQAAPPSPNKRKAAFKPRHRRSETMEQKLFGLAVAIDQVYAQNLDSFESDLEGEQVEDEQNPNKYDPTSSADALSQNASLLYRRIKKNDDLRREPNPDEDHSDGIYSSSSSSRRWRKVRNAVRATTSPKKGIDNMDENDGAIENPTADEEVGPADVGGGGSSGGGGGVASGNEDINNGKDKPDSWSRFKVTVAGDWKVTRELQDFLKPMKRSIRLFLKLAVLYFMLPSIGVAAILFYGAGNPPVGVLQRDDNGTLASVNTDGRPVDPNVASVSWWLLFIVRQFVTFSLALSIEVFVVDFLSIRTGLIYRAFGSWATLFILQTRTWPFVLFFWALFDFILLSGLSGEVASWWLFWQQPIGLVNASNPSGNVVNNIWYHRVLASAMGVAAAAAVKRFWMGLYLGKQTFTQYSDKLASAMKKILLISQVAGLGKSFERQTRNKVQNQRGSMVSWRGNKLEGLMQNADDESIASGRMNRSEKSLDFNAPLSNSRSTSVIDPTDRHPLTGKLTTAQSARITQLLGAFEEPTIHEKITEPVSVNALLQFRRALACLNTDFVFSGSFGPAGCREDTIASSQEVYKRLLLRSEDPECLDFDVLALLGVSPDGTLDQQKLVDLIKLFRPNRDGTLSMIDFVRSVDKVYREIRLLRASVSNASKLDAATESILNVVYYAILITIVLAAVGLDPLALFLSISGVVLAFAFMISSASSKYFEGLLFILVRRPYSIGDAIHISDPNSGTEYTGSAWWLVEDVTLFTTTVVFYFTNERATLSNGSLANSRIINSSRSPHAALYHLLKFPVDVQYEKMALYHEALRSFVLNRPREWLALTAFRATRVEHSQGFIEYMVAVDHRLSWADWTIIRTSQSDLMAFTVELSKKLDIWYKNPPLPVNLSFVGDQPRLLGPSLPTIDENGPDMSSLVQPLLSPDLRGLQAKFAPQTSPQPYNT